MAVRRAESKVMKKKNEQNRAKKEAQKEATRLASYFRQSKDLKNSVVLVLPLFVAYQVGILFSGGVRNGADFVTDALLGLIRALMQLPKNAAEPEKGDVLLAYLAVNLMVGLILLGVAWHFRRRGRFSSKLFPLLLLESSLYALFFSTFVSLMMRALGLDGLLRASFETFSPHLPQIIAPALAAGVKGLSLIDRIVMSIGAGLYEELVFRLLLMGGLFHILSRTLTLPKISAALLALFLSSLVFSGVHHLGNMGEVFSLSAFSYRFFAGLLLALIFHIRGFAVAVYTHALYDVLVLVLRS